MSKRQALNVIGDLREELLRIEDRINSLSQSEKRARWYDTRAKYQGRREAYERIAKRLRKIIERNHGAA